ncbi:hypothetical protein K457DRAFT_127174 [Linnemannia elongata AG-77]|uniref:Uncharacterized protein n=1 Tax=Linnemannia elongata AG-77 TaxID=1314771 RepID=A0A197JU41_9FUNG|nr:hypothetical protein K457DRAFT_127174 [Linnemannia elongata AG-77]
MSVVTPQNLVNVNPKYHYGNVLTVKVLPPTANDGIDKITTIIANMYFIEFMANDEASQEKYQWAQNPKFNFDLPFIEGIIPAAATGLNKSLKFNSAPRTNIAAYPTTVYSGYATTMVTFPTITSPPVGPFETPQSTTPITAEPNVASTVLDPRPNRS